MILAILALAVPASGQDRFVFGTQWSAQAQFAGYYVAYENGFYAEEGLDVEIRHPFSTQTAESRVRSGECDAIMLPLSEALMLVDKGLPLVNVLQTSMNSAYMLISRYGSDPLTLKNAKVITWRAGYCQIPMCMAKKEQLDYQWVEASNSVNIFFSGAVDATIAMSYNEYYQILQSGLMPPEKGIYRFSEHGYNIQDDGVYAIQASYRKDPERFERFARASRRGWEWAAEHPEETLDIVMKYVKSFRIPTNRVMQKLMLDEILRLQLDQDSGHRDFRLRPDMVMKAGELMLDAGFLTRSITYEEIMP